MRIQIVQSTALHARELSLTLRSKDKLEAETLGLDPRKALFNSYRRATYRKTCLINDEVAAMWGVVGTLMGVTGQPYLITGEKVSRVSALTFARIYKQEALKMKELFPVLENYVDASYKGAVRMLEIAGFTLEDPFEYNGAYLRKFRMVD